MPRSIETELKMQSPNSRQCVGRRESDSRQRTDIVQKYYRLKTESTQGPNINQTDSNKNPDIFQTERHSPDSVIQDQERQSYTLESRQSPKKRQVRKIQDSKTVCKHGLDGSKLSLTGSIQIPDRFQIDTESLDEVLMGSGQIKSLKKGSRFTPDKLQMYQLQDRV